MKSSNSSSGSSGGSRRRYRSSGGGSEPPSPGPSVQETPLMRAVLVDNYTEVQSLIETGADVNEKVGYRTALHVASILGHISSIHVLLGDRPSGAREPTPAEIARVDETDDKGRTALHWASVNGHNGIVQYLIEKKGANKVALDNEQRTPLHLGAMGGSSAVINSLTNKYKVDINPEDNQKYTPLMLAFLEVKIEAIEQSTVYQVLPTIELNNSSHGVLDLPVSQVNHQAMVSHIKGLLPELAIHNRTNPVKYLLTKGADPSLKNISDRPAIFYAIRKNNSDIFQALLEASSFDVEDSVDLSRKWTALHLASFQGRLEFVKDLVEKASANLNPEDANSKTPLDIAKDRNHTEVIIYLESKGAN